MVRGHDAGGTYHHGNLRQALVDAGVELARRGGPEAVVLRAVTRMAQVSHNAAYRHFASQEDLVAAVAEACMDQLGLLMIARSDAVRTRGHARRAQARFVAIGRAYIEFALAEPGWFRTAFSAAQPHEDKPSPGPQSVPAVEDGGSPTNPYLLLSAHLDELVEVGALPPDRRPGAEYYAWSSVHGLASLLVSGPLRYLPADEMEFAIDLVVTAVPRGLA